MALNFFWVEENSVSLLTTILQGPGDSNHKLAQETAPASGVMKVAFLPIQRTLEECFICVQLIWTHRGWFTCVLLSNSCKVLDESWCVAFGLHYISSSDKVLQPVCHDLNIHRGFCELACDTSRLPIFQNDGHTSSQTTLFYKAEPRIAADRLWRQAFETQYSVKVTNFG